MLFQDFSKSCGFKIIRNFILWKLTKVELYFHFLREIYFHFLREKKKYEAKLMDWKTIIQIH